MDTIFALSSGSPPAGIALVRVSGPAAGAALESLAGKVPSPRRATRAKLRDRTGGLLDDGLVLWFPGPGTATGEDLAELHLHGGRAVVMAVEAALAALPGLRRAYPGEFTRRAFANGRVDLAEAEGLADLLQAETELQRRAAVSLAGGALNVACVAWHRDFAAKAHELGYAIVWSLSYELFDAHCWHDWKQRAPDGAPALTGWVPPSTLLSPCHAQAMAYLHAVARAFVALGTQAGMAPLFQVGEPWWWTMPDGAPCLYDAAAVAALSPVPITTLRGPLWRRPPRPCARRCGAIIRASRRTC